MALNATQGTNGVGTGFTAKAPEVPTWVFKPVANDTAANRESNQAVQLMKDGKPGEALKLLAHALALPKEDATDTAALYNRSGVALNRMGDQAGAIAMFQKADI